MPPLEFTLKHPSIAKLKVYFAEAHTFTYKNNFPQPLPWFFLEHSQTFCGAFMKYCNPFMRGTINLRQIYKKRAPRRQLLLVCPWETQKHLSSPLDRNLIRAHNS